MFGVLLQVAPPGASHKACVCALPSSIKELTFYRDLCPLCLLRTKSALSSITKAAFLVEAEFRKVSFLVDDDCHLKVI